MRNYEKFLRTYIVQSDFTVVDKYDNNREIIINKDTILEYYPSSYSEEESKEKYFNYENGGNILIPIELVNKHIKSEFDIYQEKFNHLDKNHLYFGQIDQNEEFQIKSIEKTKKYIKIGEYITSDGKTYNAVEINDGQVNWKHDDKKSYEGTQLTYFEEDYLIKKDCKFYYKEQKLFFPTLSIEVCEVFVEFPQMLEIMDCFFRNQPLTQEQEYIYDSYHEYIDNKELLGCGFYSPQNNSIEEIKEDVEYNKKNRKKYY